MAWQDRDYNQSGESGGGYLGNPISALNISVPFGTWFGARVRLHFWLLLSILFIVVGGMRMLSPTLIVINVALLIAALLLHEFGHRFTARWVDGSHDDMMLWPAGGMIPPTSPPTPLATFVAHVGGIAMNILLAIASYAVLGILHRELRISFNPFALMGTAPADAAISLKWILGAFAGINLSVAFIAAFPYYWFDGAYLLQAILWPFTGLHNATNITCIVGMVLAVPMFILSVATMSLFGMIFWVLLFADSYRRRKDLKFSGYEGEAAYSSAYAAPESAAKPKRPSRLKRMMEKRSASRTRDLERQVDEILAKVAQSGMHSLSEKEKSTLERASRELRDQR